MNKILNNVEFLNAIFIILLIVFLSTIGYLDYRKTEKKCTNGGMVVNYRFGIPFEFYCIENE